MSVAVLLGVDRLDDTHSPPASVCLEEVSAEQVVVHAGDIRSAGIDRGRLWYLQLACRRRAVCPGHHSSPVAGTASPGVRTPRLDGFPLAP
jgi:hypothetical protein